MDSLLASLGGSVV